MTNERDKNEMDDFVSETYRALADEETPEHLNESVLRLAAARAPNARKLFSFGAWMKPAAWAATVGLSLAIVIEVTQFTDMPVTEPTTEMPSAPAPASESEPPSVRDQFVPQGSNVLDEAERIAKLRSGSIQSNNEVVDTPMPNKIEPRAEESAGSSLEYRAENATPSSVQAQAEVPALVAQPVSSATDRRITQVQAQSAAAPERSRLQQKSDAIGACKGAARKTAETWFACIELLRESGKSAEADRENKAFLLQHPDFLPPK